MEAKVIDERMKAEWDKYVESNPLAIAWHRYDWCKVVQKHYKVKFYPIAAISENNIRGIFPVYIVKTLMDKKKMVSVPYAVAGGIIADNEEIESALLNKSIELLNELKCQSITLKQYKRKISGNLNTDNNFYNCELDLTLGPVKIWEQIGETNKLKISSVPDGEVMIEYPFDDIDAFYNLLLKHHHRKGIPCASKRWIRDLIRFNMYSIAILKSNGQIKAGVMVKEFKKTVSLPFTCMLENSDECIKFVYKLYWELIKKHAMMGMKIFHSARLPRSNETEEYRLGWGGAQYGYYYQYYPPRVKRTEFRSKRGIKRKLSSAIWKKLPLSFVRLLNPIIVKNFP